MTPSSSAGLATFRFSNKNIRKQGQLSLLVIFFFFPGATILVAATLFGFRSTFPNTVAFETYQVSVRSSYGVGSSREGERGSEWGFKHVLPLLNALGKASFPDPGPTAAALLRSFCPDATAAQTPLQHSIPSRLASLKFCAGCLT